MDQLACIKAFLKVVEEGSIHRAAQKLCQTDAAVSKKLAKLEASLNSKLLVRASGYNTLTEVGKRYYAACQEAVAKLAEAESFVKHSYATPRGELTVLVSRYLFQELIAPKLESFMSRYPLLRLKFNTAERTVNFEQDKVDILFAIAMPPPQPEKLVRVKMNLDFTRNIICATPDYFAKYKIPQKPHDLLQHRYLSHIHQYPFNTISFDEGLELDLQPFLQFDETDPIIMAAKQHLGFIAVREFKIKKELATGDFVEVLARYNQTQVTRYSYYRPQPYHDAKIQAFLDYFS